MEQKKRGARGMLPLGCFPSGGERGSPSLLLQKYLFQFTKADQKIGSRKEKKF